MIRPYMAACIQPKVHMCYTREDIEKNLKRCQQLIDFTAGYMWEHPCRLITFPEYFLQGVTTPGKGKHGRGSFVDKAVEIPGPEIERLAQKAKQYSLYIAGCGIIETDPLFPGHWFNTGIVIDPNGEVILQYRKYHVPAFIGLGTSPHDIMDEYREKVGWNLKTLFPVADTEIGKIGVMTCHDGTSPEISRALAFNGAEIIVRGAALQELEGVSQPWDNWKFTNRTRCHDNLLYMLAPNWGEVEYDYYPQTFCPGHSMIIDYHGNLLAEAQYPGEGVIATRIDIEALRQRRSLIWHNLWADLRTEAFRELYEHTVYPPNLFSEGRRPEKLADKMLGAAGTMRAHYERGTLTQPSDPGPSLEERIAEAQKRGLLR